MDGSICSEGNQGLCYSFLGRVASAITRLVGLYKARCSIARCTKQLSKLTKECAPLSAPASNTSGDRCQSGKQHVWCAIVCQIATTETLKSGADLKKAALPLNGRNANKQQASCFLKLETTPLWIQMPVQCYQRQQNLWMLILPTKKRTTLLLLSKTALLWTGFHDPKINKIYKMDKNSK